MDGLRLKDVQKHRLASQNEDCHSKKTFPGASSGTALVQKKKCFVRTQEGFDIYKTGKSKRYHPSSWREQKIEPDRPSPKKPSFRDKSISFFFHSDKHDLEQLVLLQA